MPDDDEDVFGDFKFATTSASAPDDDWGDFVQSPLTFPAAGAAVVDPFANFGSYNGTFSDSTSEFSGKKAWEKPKGAIPLSVFGEELVGEESGDKELVFGGSGSFLTKGSVKRDGDSSAATGGGSNLADLIANLYGDAAKDEGQKENVLKVGDFRNEDAIDDNGWEFMDANSLPEAHNGDVLKNELGFFQNGNIESIAPESSILQDRKVKVDNAPPLELTTKEFGFDNSDWVFKDALSENGQSDELVLDNEVSSNNIATGSAHSTSFVNGKVDSFDLFDEPNGSFFGFNNSAEKDFSGSTLSVDLLFGLERENEQNSIAARSTKDLQKNGSILLHSNCDVDYSQNDSCERFVDINCSLDVKRDENAISKSRCRQSCNNNFSIQKFNNFYNALREESRSLAFHHLEGLKKKKVEAALSGKDEEVSALIEEIQSAYNRLQKENVVSGKVYPLDLPSGASHVDMLLESVKDADLQLLEFEYHLESQILMAKENLNSSVRLFEHAHWMLRVMSLESTYDQKRYIDLWSNMVLACSFELEYGSKIWKQSSQQNIPPQILTDSRGHQYFVAIGEIYRVVEILRCSATVYKPWLLANYEDSEKIYSCFRLCRGLWTEGGLRYVLESIADLLSNEFGVYVRTLLKSLNAVCDLDEVALQKYMPNHDVPVCLLSLLSFDLIPGMKAVTWDGENYFLTLANFWANKISRSPPHLTNYVG